MDAPAVGGDRRSADSMWLRMTVRTSLWPCPLRLELGRGVEDRLHARGHLAHRLDELQRLWAWS
jgi:hypothetical protein